jgi:hypothetical protein
MQNSSREFSFTHLRELRRELTASPLSAAEICARYLLLHLDRRHPKQWLSGPRVGTVTDTVAVSGNSLPTASPVGLLEVLERLNISLTEKHRARLTPLSGVPELFRRFFFRGVVLDSHEGLVGWLDGRYPLQLRLDIPSPDEMLEIQCRGLRYVSLLLNDDVQFQAYGRHRDACDFLLHDFEHAHKFYGDPQTHGGQVRFFQALWKTRSAFAPWAGDAVFNKDLDYLKSDMNSHPVHLLKYLKAVVLSAEMRKSGLRHPPLDNFWTGLFGSWFMGADVLRAVLHINHPEIETPADLLTVAEFFMRPIEITCEPAAMEAT